MAPKDTAMDVAMRAEKKASAAHDMATVVANGMGAIQSGLESIRRDVSEQLLHLRTENTRQHDDNKKSVTDGFEKVHARISTVAQAQQTIREELSGKIDASNKEAASALKDAKTDAASALKEAKQEADAEIEKANTKWENGKTYLLLFLVAVVLALIGKLTGVQISAPGV